MNMVYLWRLVFAFSLVAVLSDCGGNSIAPAPLSTASATASPVSTAAPSVAPSGMPSVVASATPKGMPTPATTQTPSPAATQTPPPSGSPSPVPSATGGQTQTFPVPPSLGQTAPPAPSGTVPPSPAAMQRRGALQFGKSARSRHRLAVQSSPYPLVRLVTALGDIDVELRPDAAPKNVANFLSYVGSGAYTNSFIHRSVPGFIIQGGGYTETPSPFTINAIPAQAPVANEFDLSNVRGTLAMAKDGSDPNSATSQWFFNLVDNSSSLDSQDGGSTVIGNVESSDGLAVMDAIAALPTVQEQSPFNQLPVIDYTSGATVQASNLVTVSSVATLAPHAPFFNGEQSQGNGVYDLTFANGNDFGFYSYLANDAYIYHFDLGYEYVFDANDGRQGVYFYDFASGHYFYTSPTFPFPYLYDFTLKTVVYYYPATGNTGHYTTNPRYFYNFATRTVINE